MTHVRTTVVQGQDFRRNRSPRGRYTVLARPPACAGAMCVCARACEEYHPVPVRSPARFHIEMGPNQGQEPYTVRVPHRGSTKVGRQRLIGSPLGPFRVVVTCPVGSVRVPYLTRWDREAQVSSAMPKWQDWALPFWQTPAYLTALTRYYLSNPRIRTSPGLLSAQSMDWPCVIQVQVLYLK